VQTFDGIAASFEQCGDDRREWYNRVDPEAAPFPGEWNRKCAQLRQMVLVRCLRPDRVLAAGQRYVSNILTPKFIVRPPHASAVDTVARRRSAGVAAPPASTTSRSGGGSPRRRSNCRSSLAEVVLGVPRQLPPDDLADERSSINCRCRR
jgi:hypothetical protein